MNETLRTEMLINQLATSLFYSLSSQAVTKCHYLANLTKAKNMLQILRDK